VPHNSTGETPPLRAGWCGGPIAGLIVGGLGAGPIGVMSVYAAPALFFPTKGAFNSSPEARLEGLQTGIIALIAIMLVWAFLLTFRHARHTSVKSLSAVGLVASLGLCLAGLDQTIMGPAGLSERDVGGAAFVIILMGLLAVPTALFVGWVAKTTAELLRHDHVVGYISIGAVFAAAIALTGSVPGNFRSASFEEALSFWLLPAIFTMGCCAISAGLPLWGKRKTGGVVESTPT
jgi:hypothetical protein